LTAPGLQAAVAFTEQDRLRQTRAFQQTLGIWVGRMREAQRVIRQLEAEVDRKDALIARLVEALPEDAAQRFAGELER
jgi:hypothetical protein